MNNQQILDNAPEGAEYISKIGYLWNDGDSWFIYEVATEEWLHLFFHEHDELELNISSLADIERIAELEKQNQDYGERIKSALHGALLDEMGNRGEGGFYNHPDYDLIKKLLEVGYE